MQVLARGGQATRAYWNRYVALRLARRYHGTMQMEFTAVFRPVPEGLQLRVRRRTTGREYPGCHACGGTRNLEEAVRLVLEANRALSQEDLLGADVIREPFKLTA